MSMHRRRFLGTLLQAAGVAVFPSVWRGRAMAAEELAVGALVGPGGAGQFAVAAAELAMVTYRFRPVRAARRRRSLTTNRATTAAVHLAG